MIDWEREVNTLPVETKIIKCKCGTPLVIGFSEDQMVAVCLPCNVTHPIKVSVR